MLSEDESITLSNDNVSDKVELSERQNDIMAFALIFLWTSLLQDHKRVFGGPLKFRVDEIETIIHELGLDDDMIMEAKLDIIEGMKLDES